MRLFLSCALLLVLLCANCVSGKLKREQLCARKADIVIAVGVQPSKYGVVKNFLKSVINSLTDTCTVTVSPYDVSMGLIVFDTTSTTTLMLGAEGGIDAVLDAVDKMPTTSQATTLHDAIYAIQSMFQSKGRKNVPHIGVLVTDGQSDIGASTAWANVAKSKGTELITIGIGAGVNKVQLEGIASSPITRNVIQTEYNLLEFIVDQIGDTFCYAICPPCLSSCSNIPNGDYQSCNGCDVYVTCSNGMAYDYRPCPSGLVWDDNLKMCSYSSNTCS